MRSLLFSLSFLSITVTQPVVAYNTYFVAEDGSGDFPTIQAAVNAAGHLDIIELGEGVFTGDGNRDVDFLGKSITIQSRGGSHESCVISCQGSDTVPHRAFLMISDELTEMTLSGVTIQGGFARESGGGVLAIGVSPTILNCRFYDNFARGDAAPGTPPVGMGGAVAVWGCTDTVIQECLFEDNETDMCGGGVSFLECEGIDVNNCTFERNICSGLEESAGGIGILSCQSVMIGECTFRENRVEWASGGIGIRASTVTVMDCDFEHNHSEGRNTGGAGASGAMDSVVEYQGCNFLANDTPGAGGAIAVVGGETSVRDCLFARNEGCYGSAFFAFEHADAEVLRCTIVENGGDATVWTSTSDIALVECTIANNRPIRGVLLYGWEASIELRSTIIVNNGGPAFKIGDDSTPTELVVCSNVFGNIGGDWEGMATDWVGQNGNICRDPCFCNLSGERLYLASNSPCAAEHSECGRMGAWPIGCESAPEPTTWGGLKQEFRGD